MLPLAKLLRRNQTRHRLYWLTSDLAISRAPADGHLPIIHEAGVRSILDLRAETEDCQPIAHAAGLGYLRLPVKEGDAPKAEELKVLTDWIEQRITTDGPVLVHCREGRGRSAMVACAALVQLGLPLFEAYQALRRARPDVVLNALQDEALRQFAQNLKHRTQAKADDGGSFHP
jgi:protein-tyrosine phosphatase